MNICIVGGGASGAFAAIAAKKTNPSAHVTIYERKNRIGKKILASGNGRCNLSNLGASSSHYYGENPSFVEPALDEVYPEKTIEIFAELGLLCKREHGGRVFPHSSQSASVVDVLRFTLGALGVETITDAEVSDINPSEEGFVAEYSIGDASYTMLHDRVIVCTGGKSAPALGGNASGHKLLASLGHKITRTTPALCQLRADVRICKPLKGIRADCRISAYCDKVKVAGSEGDVIFTDYGLSGSAILDISRVMHFHQDARVNLDFMKEHNRVTVENILSERRRLAAFPTLETFFTGILHKMIGHSILHAVGFEDLRAPSSSLSDADVSKLAANIKKFEIQVHSHNGYEHAQVTAGGAHTSQFSPYTMESKLVPGLFTAGEVLDIFGDCGGFNLQWAWSSGYVAGQNAARNTQKK
ncbi:MAG: aminoacetone oxidase family FAD-binding enzyme [Defluviitaleaceae bacterium]|nr:aminoacetone oxidase family FAD-binding enzyme [Defluviitaleaceae bacterium]